MISVDQSEYSNHVLSSEIVTSREVIMKEATIPMFSDLPVYQDDLEKIKQKKRKAFTNICSLQLNRLMTYFRKTAQDIHEATKISHPTLSDWINNKVEVQMTDDNLPKIVAFFDSEMTIDFLVYGIAKTSRDHELDERMPDLDETFEVDPREAV